MRLSLIIPAYNEEQRIKKTLLEYHIFFTERGYAYCIIVVLNGCKDRTIQVVQEVAQQYANTQIIETQKAGKGLALRLGYRAALHTQADYIGFVDADMATEPRYFEQLIAKLPQHDGAIASRYMPGAVVNPPRSLLKRWGSWLFYKSLVRILFGINFYDTQCGAKVFKRQVIASITDYLSVDGWACDIDLLYACRLPNVTIVEVPTVWHDQAGSHLVTLHAGLGMLRDLCVLKWRYYNKG